MTVEVGIQTNINFVLNLDYFTDHDFPKKNLQNKRRYMSSFLRKPRGIKVRHYVAQVLDIN